VRTLITADALGGVWHYATTLAITLAERHAVHVLLVTCGQAPSTDQLSVLQNAGRGRSVQVEHEHIDAPLEWQHAEKEQYRQLREAVLTMALNWRASIIHANEHHFGEIGNTGMPVVVVSHSDLCSWEAAVHAKAPAVVEEQYVQRVRAGLENASLVIAPSAFVAGSLSRWYGFSGVVRVLPHGVQEAEVTGRQPRTVDAMMAGRLWDEGKNAHCFERAVEGLATGVYAAAGPLQGPGAAFVPASDRLSYTGALAHQELRALFSQSKLFVSPALYDPFGLVVVEAALAGCGLILADIASYRQLWGDTAVYFPPNEPLALRRIIQVILHDPESQQRLAHAAGEHARALYSADRMAEAYLATYQRIAIRHGVAP